MIVDAAGFDWDLGNTAKCQKHGLSIADIEYVVGHAETLIVADPKHSERERRFIAVGKTETGRFAFVAFTPRSHGPATLLRPISARYMHRWDIEKYEKESAALQNR
jgi:uncharacterized DUF497 family protein